MFSVRGKPGGWVGARMHPQSNVCLCIERRLCDILTSLFVLYIHNLRSTELLSSNLVMKISELVFQTRSEGVSDL